MPKDVRLFLYSENQIGYSLGNPSQNAFLTEAWPGMAKARQSEQEVQLAGVGKAFC